MQVNVDELDGFSTSINGLLAGTVNLVNDIPAIFGTSRLNAWGSLQGVVCFNGITPPASSYIEVDGNNGFVQQVQVSFAGPTVDAGQGHDLSGECQPDRRGKREDGASDAGGEHDGQGAELDGVASTPPIEWRDG